MSLSHEFLPAEFEPASSQQPSMPSSHPGSPSSSSSTDSSAASDVSDVTEYADPVLPEEEEQHADPPSPSLPEPSAPSPSSPDITHPGHHGHAPVHDSPGAVQAAQSPATGHLGSFSPKPVPHNSPDASASEAGPSEAGQSEAGPSAAALPEEQSPRSPSAAPASFSVQATPPAIQTSSCRKPPDPSPGTAAQINKDEALARKLQTLELEDNPEAADAAAEEASGGGHGDVDLAALQDVEVPLVGDQLPLAALVEDYEGSPRVCGNLLPLMQRFPYFKRIRGQHVHLWLTHVLLLACWVSTCVGRPVAACEYVCFRASVLFYSHTVQPLSIAYAIFS